jgi:DNA-binding MarR family transcriptional regulator
VISARPGSPLDELPLYLPRVFYGFLGLIERELQSSGLDQHLAPGMGHVLLFLYEHDDCIIKDISDSIRLSQASLTGLLTRMRKAGLVTCRRCQADGRAVRIGLTPKGRSLRPRVLAFHRGVVTKLQRNLTNAEVKVAKRVLAKIIENTGCAE